MTPSNQSRLIIASVLIVSLTVTLASQMDSNLAPFLTQAQYERITQAAAYVKGHGWAQPVLVAWGSPGLYIWSLLRSYLGDQVGQTYVYYGKLQNLYFLVPPFNQSSYHLDPNFEWTSARQNYADLIQGLADNPAAVRARPVVLVDPDSYSYPVSENFLQAHGIGNGVYVIPPASVTDVQLNTWNLFAASDFTWINEGGPELASWSLAPYALNYGVASAASGFLALYSFSTSMNSTFTLHVHLLDEPAGYPPITFLVDGGQVLTHTYGGAGPLWLTVRLGPLGSGHHTLEVVSGSPGQPLAVGLDVLQVFPA